MRTAFFVIFHGFDSDSGIKEKVYAQVNALEACGLKMHLCYMDESSGKQRLIDGDVIADYGHGIISKIKKRTEFASVIRFAKENNIEFVYLRSNHNASPFTIRLVKKLKEYGMKVVMEIPTYPYDSEYKAQGISRQIFQDKLFRDRLAKYLDAIITFSDYDTIFGKRTIRISNGIDFDNVKMKSSVNNTSKELNLIGVAEIHTWHAFDRLVKGLADYYSKPQKYIVRFHVVGKFFSKEGETEFKKIIADHHIERHVILYGYKHGSDLDTIFDFCDFGVGSLGRHRVGIDRIKTLKNREYAARGIPFIYSETDSDFDDKPYVLKVPADDSPIDIYRIIDFYRQSTFSPQQIRNSIEDLSWKNQMMKVIKTIF